MPTHYVSTPPTRCDMCARLIVDEFIDGATRYGPWGDMCLICHPKHGIGLGPGRGQHYKRDETGKFIKVAG